MTTKTFDCVEMKRRGAELVQQQLAGMTRQEQLEYWRSQTELLRQRQAELRAARQNPPTTTS
jgi:hypothetical protein